MSRHEMDLERAISHDRNKAKSLAILMTNKKTDVSTENKAHPINHIKKMLRKIEKGKYKDKKKVKKKAGNEEEEEEESSLEESSDSSHEDDDLPPPSCPTFKVLGNTSSFRLMI